MDKGEVRFLAGGEAVCPKCVDTSNFTHKMPAWMDKDGHIMNGIKIFLKEYQEDVLNQGNR